MDFFNLPIVLYHCTHKDRRDNKFKQITYHCSGNQGTLYKVVHGDKNLIMRVKGLVTTFVRNVTSSEKSAAENSIGIFTVNFTRDFVRTISCASLDTRMRILT